VTTAGSTTTVVAVTHRDGREGLVDCERRSGPTELPESCGKAAVAASAWETHVRS